MSTYCKAYSLTALRQFPGWSEKSENARTVKQQGKEIQQPRKLTDNDFLYVHDSFIVTDGIFEDKNIIFDNITPEWQKFCKDKLKFEPPVYEPIEIQKNLQQ